MYKHIHDLLINFGFFSASLRYHERAHRDEVKRSQICDKCGKSSANKNDLQRHVLTHLPKEERPRPFACSLCPLTFTTATSLRRHELVHNGARDAKCEFCEKAYPRKANLKDHLMTVHQLSNEEAKASAKMRNNAIPIIKDGEEIRIPVHWATKPSTTCGFCSKKYARREYLTTHLIGVHGKTEEEAKAITGLETKRTLTVPTNARRKAGRRKKAPVEDDTEDETEEEEESEESCESETSSESNEDDEPDATE
jgi:uncharacterized Zn-finger protein